jgi:hypothetical protein
MDLFQPALRGAFFDIVIANDVLHHTGDCRAAFRRIRQLAKPGGYVIVGLYNAFGRIPHRSRRCLYRWTGLTSPWLDPRLGRMDARGTDEAWFREQYDHPQETCHTLDEVLGWMAEDGLELVRAVPAPDAGKSLGPGDNLFTPQPSGTWLQRLQMQLSALASGYRDGGSFLMIGRRRPGVVS